VNANGTNKGLTSLKTAPKAMPPAHAAADWTIDQRWHEYTRAQHDLWDRLYRRQVAQLPGRATSDFLRGLEVLDLTKPGIPEFTDLSERLQQATGWSVVAVPGLVPDEVFFDHLAHRRFVAGRFLRSPAQIDYLQEPDIFHDVFGHVPLLALPVYADYMQAYGQGGLRAMSFNAIHRLARLYWHTVEFGLIREGPNLRIFGAGIVSSHGETSYALDDPTPLRLRFDLQRVLRTRYHIHHYQQNYFIIDSFEDLLRQTVDTDFAPLYAELESQSDIEPGVLLSADQQSSPCTAL
jgi:phenylalanine-4-hydroxylase